MQGEGNTQEDRVKYQLIYHSMEKKLNEILESQSSSLKDIRMSSSHQFTQPKSGEKQVQENILNRFKTIKKVGFQPMTGLEYINSIKEIGNTHANHLKPRKSINPSLPKSIKSMNCSFAVGLVRSQSTKSNRSIRTINPELAQAKQHASQILKKLDVFFTTQISHKQIIEWLHAYCEKQKCILLKLFLKYRKISCCPGTKLKKSTCSLELDEDVLHKRLQMKLRDSSQGMDRYVTALQVKQLSLFIENSFIDKMKIKTKQFQESIAKKMEIICEKIRKENDNEFVLNIRKKPIEISNFLTDVKNFEDTFGSMKKINTLNRVRFKMLNDTDDLINRHVKKINEEVESSKKIQSVGIIS